MKGRPRPNGEYYIYICCPVGIPSLGLEMTRQSGYVKTFDLIKSQDWRGLSGLQRK